MKYTAALIAGAQALDINLDLDLGGLASAVSGAAAEAGVGAEWWGGGGKRYRSGSIGTKEAFRYGRFSTRMKGWDKPGTVTSLFTYWKGPGWNMAGWSEIDVELAPSAATGGRGSYSTNLIWKHHAMSGHFFVSGSKPRR